jgi:hypothetical protein
MKIDIKQEPKEFTPTTIEIKIENSEDLCALFDLCSLRETEELYEVLGSGKVFLDKRYNNVEQLLKSLACALNETSFYK